MSTIEYYKAEIDQMKIRHQELMDLNADLTKKCEDLEEAYNSAHKKKLAERRNVEELARLNNSLDSRMTEELSRRLAAEDTVKALIKVINKLV
jgi:hypothetical protein